MRMARNGAWNDFGVCLCVGTVIVRALIRSMGSSLVLHVALVSSSPSCRRPQRPDCFPAPTVALQCQAVPSAKHVASEGKTAAAESLSVVCRAVCAEV